MKAFITTLILYISCCSQVMVVPKLIIVLFNIIYHNIQRYDVRLIITSINYSRPQSYAGSEDYRNQKGFKGFKYNYVGSRISLQPCKLEPLFSRLCVLRLKRFIYLFIYFDLILFSSLSLLFSSLLIASLLIIQLVQTTSIYSLSDP